MCVLGVRAQGLDANIKTVHEQHTHVLTSLRLRFVSSPDLATPDKDVRFSLLPSRAVHATNMKRER